MRVMMTSSAVVTGAFFGRKKAMSLHQCRDAPHQRMRSAREVLLESHIEVGEEGEDAAVAAVSGGVADGARYFLRLHRQHHARGTGHLLARGGLEKIGIGRGGAHHS